MFITCVTSFVISFRETGYFHNDNPIVSYLSITHSLIQVPRNQFLSRFSRDPEADVSEYNIIMLYNIKDMFPWYYMSGEVINKFKSSTILLNSHTLYIYIHTHTHTHHLS